MVVLTAIGGRKGELDPTWASFFGRKAEKQSRESTVEVERQNSALIASFGLSTAYSTMRIGLPTTCAAQVVVSLTLPVYSYSNRYQHPIPVQV